MVISKRETETYVISGANGLENAVTVYVTNYCLGKGKMVIECCGECWAHYWGAMGDNNLQSFFVECENYYLLNKFIGKTKDIDFDKINDDAKKAGMDVRVSNWYEIGCQISSLEQLYGNSIYEEGFPECDTTEYEYLGKIIDAIKLVFEKEKEANEEETRHGRVVTLNCPCCGKRISVSIEPPKAIDGPKKAPPFRTKADTTRSPLNRHKNRQVAKVIY